MMMLMREEGGREIDEDEMMTKHLVDDDEELKQHQYSDGIANFQVVHVMAVNL